MCPKLYRISALILSIIFSQSYLILGSTTGESMILFDFNDCDAALSGGNRDYSEFSGEIENCEGGPILEVMNGSLYRLSAQSNTHSCTRGLDFTSSMCVSADLSCEFTNSSSRAVRFDVRVTPSIFVPSILSELSFYESSPTTYAWNGGGSGPNNQPTRYGVRVSVGGNEVYKKTGLKTTTGFTLGSFDFSDLPAFKVTSTTVFKFELTSYCVVNNGADLSIWDLEDIKIVARNEINEGHNIVGGPFSFCVDDGISDFIDADAISLIGAGGSNRQWIITNTLGDILALPSSFTAVDFEESGIGTCLIWHLNYENGLTGLSIGNNINTLQGNFDLSNSIAVIRSKPSGGTLTGGPFSFCPGDNVEDRIPSNAILLSGNTGSNSQWLVTDNQGNILSTPFHFSDVDFNNLGTGTCRIWHLSYEIGLSGLAIGSNVSNLFGCFNLSNNISVTRSRPDGGNLSGGPFSFCTGDGLPDRIGSNEITVSGISASNRLWVVTDDKGIILALPTTFSEVDFDGAGIGTCFVRHLGYEGQIFGAFQGNNISNLSGCFDLSNSIAVFRSQTNGGFILGNTFTFCVQDGNPDRIGTNEISLSGNIGKNSQWVLTDDNQNILELPSSFSDLNFDNSQVGTCFLWHLSYEDNVTGIQVGLNLSNIQGCHNLSNSLVIEKTRPNGGIISGGPFSFCVGDGIADNIATNEIILTGSNGTFSQWLITDNQGNILSLPDSFSDVNFDNSGSGICRIWHLSYENGLSGLAEGLNISALFGCFNISNNITVIRTQPEGGTLLGGPFTFCVGDAEPDNIPINGITLIGNIGSNFQWIVTDIQGNILGLPASFSDVNFDSSGIGTCLIRHLSYENGLSGLGQGMNVSNLLGCFNLSNSISVIRSQAKGGTIEGGPFSFCVGDWNL